MKKYKYVTLKVGNFWGAKSTEHRQVIDKCAEKGYRYVGYIPANMDAHGRLREMELVFEKDC